MVLHAPLSCGHPPIFTENGGKEGGRLIINKVFMMRQKRSTPKVMYQACELRHNQTPAEIKLWRYLRKRQRMGYKFRRQYAIGRYIVDYCALSKKLIIELDGSPHNIQKEYDFERTKFLMSQGYQVLRFWNNDVINNIDEVIKTIDMALSKK